MEFHYFQLVLFVQEVWESVDHWLLYCNYVSKVWYFIFSVFGIWWVIPRKVVDVLHHWKGICGKHLECDPSFSHVDYLEGEEWVEHSLVEVKALLLKSFSAVQCLWCRVLLLV